MSYLADRDEVTEGLIDEQNCVVVIIADGASNHSGNAIDRKRMCILKAVSSTQNRVRTDLGAAATSVIHQEKNRGSLRFIDGGKLRGASSHQKHQKEEDGDVLHIVDLAGDYG